MAKQIELTDEELKAFLVTDEDSEQVISIQPSRQPIKVNCINIEYREGLRKSDQLPYAGIYFMFQEVGKENKFEMMCKEPVLSDKLFTLDESKRGNFKYGLSQLIHTAGAFMPPSTKFRINWNDNTYKKVFEEMMKLIVPDYKTVPAAIKVTYSDSGQIQMPMFPNFITSKLKDRTIVFEPSDITNSDDPRIVIKPKKEKGGGSAPTKSTPSAGGLWDTAASTSAGTGWA
jgi:hypothetical protein